MNTAFMLMAQYEGRSVIPVEVVCRDYFSHLDSAKFIRKARSGEIKIPLIEIEDSQKAAKGVHLNDLAAYIDTRHAAALKACARLT